MYIRVNISLRSAQGSEAPGAWERWSVNSGLPACTRYNALRAKGRDTRVNLYREVKVARGHMDSFQ